MSIAEPLAARARHRRRGAVVCAAACLLFGACATVGVAVTAFNAGTPGDNFEFVVSESGRQIGECRGSAWATVFHVGPEVLSTQPLRDGIRALCREIAPWAARPPPIPDGALPRPARDVSAWTFAVGWPCRAMKMVAWNRHSLQRPYRGEGVRTITLSRGRTVEIPTLPIWPGLLANIAFWSALAAAPIFGLPALRRHLRARRGVCRECGYERSGLGPDVPCPECGFTRRERTPAR